MHLTPKELDKLLLLSAGMVAERRLKKGLKLNYPEAVAYITCAALEGAREGKTVEEVVAGAADDVDLKAGCTVGIDSQLVALQKAAEAAK